MKQLTLLASIQHHEWLEKALDRVFASSEILPSKENVFRVDAGKGHEAIITICFTEKRKSAGYVRLREFRDFYAGRTYQEESLKVLILAQLSLVNAILDIRMSTAFSPVADNLPYRKFTELAAAINAVIHLEDASLFDHTGKMIVHPDGRKGNARFQLVAAERRVPDISPASEEGRIRKNRSIEKLEALGMGVAEHLPELPPSDVIVPRTRMEVAQRAATVLVIIHFASAVTDERVKTENARQAAVDRLKKYGLLSCMTEREKGFLFSLEPDKTEAIRIIWDCEAYWVLIWALGLLPELPFPDASCHTDVATAALFPCDSFIDFYKKTRLRPVNEILDEADLNYRYNQVCAQSGQDGKASKAMMNPDVIFERMRAFEWLLRLNESDWDVIVASDPAPENRLAINGRIYIDNVSDCFFRSHEDVLEDESYCFYGYETLPGAKIDIWGRSVAFRAQVSPRGTPVVLAAKHQKNRSQQDAGLLPENRRTEINGLKTEFRDNVLPFDRRIEVAWRHREDKRPDVHARIDYVDTAIGMATGLIREAQEETLSFPDNPALAASRRWENPDMAIRAINYQIILLKEMDSLLTGPFTHLLTETPIRTETGKSAAQQAMGFFLDGVEVTVRESESSSAFDGSMTLLFRNAPPGKKSHAIRVWLDDGFITGILPSWK